MKVLENHPEKRKLIKRMLFPVLAPIFNRYLTKERSFRFKDISVKVHPGVFHPGLFFSTKNLLKFLEKETLCDKTFLELGAGTGLLSIFAAKRKAKVTASDISSKAVMNIKVNFSGNNIDAEILQSDLFEKIPPKEFDFIFINPPFYNKTPLQEKDYAWFCGEDFQYFRKLFKQIHLFISENSKVIMILSEDCEIEKIKLIAAENKIELIELKKIKNWCEWNYILKLNKIHNLTH